jgi:hypothetical protein
VTSDEIRKISLYKERADLELFREIAAQLAEINFHLSDLCYKADVMLKKYGPVS